ncbi:MAG: tetratricopeptide repeat protein, partial [Bdellovibrio sp.]
RWYQANASNRALIESAESLLESTLRNWTLQQHQAAQKTKAKSSQLLAAEGYALYLGYFKKSQQLGDMHFYYGEVLYDLGRFDESSLQYRWVLENAPQSRFASKAAENVVFALEKTLPKDDEIARRVGKSLDPVSFPKEAQNFISTALWFSTKFPQHPKNLEILFRLGRLHYQHNQFESAIPYFQQVIQRDPKSKPAEFSANLLLDIYNLKKDYAGLEKVGMELLQIPVFRGTKAANEIQDILSKARFKGLQSQEGQLDAAVLAEQYEDFGRKNLQSPVGKLALLTLQFPLKKAVVQSEP